MPKHHMWVTCSRSLEDACGDFDNLSRDLLGGSQVSFEALVQTMEDPPEYSQFIDSVDYKRIKT